MTPAMVNLQLLSVMCLQPEFKLCWKKDVSPEKFCFCLIFVFLCWGFPKESHVSLPCFFSICAIAPLIIYFDLKLKNMLSKIPISLLYYSISVFKILLQIFLLIYSLLVLRNLISVKVLMVSCCQTKFWDLLPKMSKEYNHLKKIELNPILQRQNRVNWSTISIRKSL